MYIKGSSRRDHRYFAVVMGERCRDDVKHKTVLNIGRVDNLTEPRRLELEREIKTLGETDVLKRFRQLLYSIEYPLPTVSLEEIDIVQALDYGELYALHTLWNKLTIPDIIQKHTIKGGGKDLAQFVEILTIHRICEPGSREQTARWYPKTYLPFLLKLEPKKVYPRVLLRSLEYLQPERTRKIEKEIYAGIKREFNFETSRVDVDLTSVYFEGEDCILAEFGYNRDGKKDKLQIVVGLAVDQKGFLLTHFVFPGNKTDVKTLKATTHVLRRDFGVSKTLFVMDRGMTSKNNIGYMDRKKDDYLITLKLNKHEKALFNETRGLNDDSWTKIDDKISVTLLDKKENGRDKRYLVGINSEIADKRRLERNLRLTKAKKELRMLKRNIRLGKIASRKERERRIGAILKKRMMKKYLACEGARKGLGFGYRTNEEKIAGAEGWDGIFLMVTTDTSLSTNEMIAEYRVRDCIEKVIRTMKSVLDIRPINVRQNEQVRGHVFICALAYQLRAVAQQFLKRGNVDMSVDEALDTLKRLKVVDIRVGKDDTQVRRMVMTPTEEQKMVVDVFSMRTKDGVLPL
jgi:transposase